MLNLKDIRKAFVIDMVMAYIDDLEQVFQKELFPANTLKHNYNDASQSLAL